MVGHSVERGTSRPAVGRPGSDVFWPFPSSAWSILCDDLANWVVRGQDVEDGERDIPDTNVRIEYEVADRGNHRAWHT
jgi:hypothetical protein